MRINGFCARRVIVVGLALCAHSCNPSDPGWHYKSDRGTAVHDDGLRYELPERAGVKARVYASLFAGTIDVELEIVNAEQGLLEVNTRALAVKDAGGATLRKRMDRPPQCGGQLKEGMCTLAQGQSCKLAGVFQVHPFAAGLGGLLRHKNEDLREISVGLAPGAKRQESGELEWGERLVWTE
jgi:hypothetical protein